MPALLGGELLVHLQGRISSKRSMTAWLSEPSVSTAPACCSARPGRCRPEVARSWGRSRPRWRARRVHEVGAGEVRGVDDRRQRPEGAGVVQEAGGRDAVRRQAGVVLGDLLGQVRVERAAAAATTVGSSSRGTARTEWIAAPIRVRSSSFSCATRSAQAAADRSL